MKAKLRKLYDDSVVLYIVNLDSKQSLSRKTRSILASPTEGYNLATPASEDYPAIFNIVLVMGIVLTIALIAISFSMAYMDPGRDSIIYRMTNPRMKKD